MWPKLKIDFKKAALLDLYSSCNGSPWFQNLNLQLGRILVQSLLLKDCKDTYNGSGFLALSPWMPFFLFYFKTLCLIVNVPAELPEFLHLYQSLRISSLAWIWLIGFYFRLHIVFTLISTHISQYKECYQSWELIVRKLRLIFIFWLHRWWNICFHNIMYLEVANK